jgi:hypothetical protein
MKIPNKIVLPFAAIALMAGGAVATMAVQSHAATSTATATTSSSTNTPNPTHIGKHHGRAPLGGDGNITAINGKTLTMQEEADENGASYTIDATNATISNNGANGALTDLKIGDKIFVQGTTSFTNVVATSISLGHPGGRHHGSPETSENPAQ